MRHWLKSLATFTAAVLVAGNPITPQIVRAQVTPGSTPSADVIDIPVPQPERRTNGICPDVLPPMIDNILNSPSLASGRWGVVIESMNSNQVFYSRNPNQLLIPASNTKLFTTAAALQVLDLRNPTTASSLREWVRVTNLTSNNAQADSLLRRLGGPTTAQRALAQLGLDSGSYRLADGSGLSRANQATPTSLVKLLRAMPAANGGEMFYTSLPVGGVSGTLRNRFRNTAAQGRVRAKTGTLTGVRALSGYLEHPEHGAIAFSILANHPGQSGDVLINAIDQVVLQTARMTTCD